MLWKCAWTDHEAWRRSRDRHEPNSPVDGGGDGVIAHVDARRADEVRAAEEVRLAAARRIHEVDEADLDVFFVE